MKKCSPFLSAAMLLIPSVLLWAGILWVLIHLSGCLCPQPLMPIH